MSFLFKDRGASYPVGSIIQYMGNNDPDGWIICNGILRTEPDGRFEALSNLLNSMTPGSSHTNTMCTPPDLSEKIMCGKSTDQIGSVGGSKSKTLEYTNIPSHTHTITDGIGDQGHDHGGFTGAHSHTFTATKHTHTISNDSHSHSYTRYESTPPQWAGPNVVWFGVTTRQTGTSKANVTINDATTSGSIGSSKATIPDGESNISLQDAGKATPDSFDVMPPYFVINHIIKY